MTHERPNRASSHADSVNRAAQRLGQALANADMTRPDKYQALQQRALKLAEDMGGFDANQRLTERGMQIVAQVIEDATR